MALTPRVILGAVALLIIVGVACATTPTPTPVPTPTESPTPVVKSSLADTAFEYITELSEGLGPRASTTDQEKAAAEYLESQFIALGWLHDGYGQGGVIGCHGGDGASGCAGEPTCLNQSFRNNRPRM